MAFLKIAALGFGGLIALTVLFGKRIEKRWEYEAKFRNAKGREVGEFDIELKRYAKEGGDFQLEAKLVLRHAALQPGDTVEVVLDGRPVMRGPVENAGRIRLNEAHLTDSIDDPAEGQSCVLLHEGQALFDEPLQRD